MLGNLFPIIGTRDCSFVMVLLVVPLKTKALTLTAAGSVDKDISRERPPSR